MTTIVNSASRTFEWLRAVQVAIAAPATDDLRLTHVDATVAISLTRFIGTDGTFFRSLRNIAEDCAVTETTARNAVNRLRAGGFLIVPGDGVKITTKGLGGRPARTYQAVLPESFRKEDCGNPSTVSATEIAETGGVSASQIEGVSANQVAPILWKEPLKEEEGRNYPPTPKSGSAQDATVPEPETGTEIVVAETTAPARAREARPGDPDFAAFEEFASAYAAAYPNDGASPTVETLIADKAARLRFARVLRSGATGQEIVSAAHRYAARCRAEARPASMVKAPANFLGNDFWREDHTPDRRIADRNRAPAARKVMDDPHAQAVVARQLGAALEAEEAERNRKFWGVA